MTSHDDNTVNDDDITARYELARALMNGYGNQQLVQNDTIFPVWIEGSNCFWYERTVKLSSGQPGKEYRLVDANAQSNHAAFNHQQLARALSKASGEKVNPQDLPIDQVVLSLSPLRICFTAFEQRWRFDGEQGHCEALTSTILPPTEVLSPDGTQIAFLRDNDLWVREVETGEERALTQDGEDDLTCCAATTVWGTRLRRGWTPAALWSPDGARLLTVRRDTRQVKPLPMIDYVPQDGSLRPQLSNTRVAYPGDEHIETWLPMCVEVATGKLCAADISPIASGLGDHFSFWGNLFWWGPDSRQAYIIDQTRGDRILRLLAFDTDSGAIRVLFEESSDTHINLYPDTVTQPLHRFLSKTNELVWWSERSGYGHLYLYDLNAGELKHAITAGEWCVRDVIKVDEMRRELWIQTGSRTPGRDPYYRDICRVNIDTAELRSVFAGDEEVVVHFPDSVPVKMAGMPARSLQPVSGVSPQNDYVVATRSRADRAAETVLLDREGTQLLTVETAGVSSLPDNWQWPDTFKVTAADGITELYGLMFRPPGFSPDQSYPVINYVFNAPWLSIVPKGSFHNGSSYHRHYFHGAALAALGFIVVFVDTRGTPLRSKAFQDAGYGWIPASANNDDHIHALRQLAERHPYMDMSRVGVFGQAYRSSLQHFLECQDVYKVCVQMSVLDSRLVGAFEQDKWEGPSGPDGDKPYPEQLVDKLQGRLLLMHAMTSWLSAAYQPAALFRMVEALQKANKDFDMVLVPHGGMLCNSYMYRRAFDYLLKHLLGVEPPRQIDLGRVNM